MLTLYRRHTRSCGQKDRYYRRSKCPVWVEGTTNDGEYIRHSLKLTSWERGEEKKRLLELGPDAAPSDPGGHPYQIESRSVKRSPSSVASANHEILAIRPFANTGHSQSKF